MYKVIIFAILFVAATIQCSESKEKIALEKTQTWLSKVTGKKYSLNQLKKLKELRITDDDVETIELIKNLKSLEDLDLSNTQVTGLTPLKESGNLKILNLSYTPVRDLSPLKSLKSLKELILIKTPITDKHLEELKKALPKCDIVHQLNVKFSDKSISNWEDGAEFRLSVAIYALDKKRVFLCGSINGASAVGSLVLRGDDGGKNWTEVMEPVAGSEASNMYFVDHGVGWVTTLLTSEGIGDARLFQTKDYGKTWKEITTLSWSHGTPIFMRFINQKNGIIAINYDYDGTERSDKYAAIKYTVVLNTKDGGLTWEETGRIPYKEFPLDGNSYDKYIKYIHSEIYKLYPSLKNNRMDSSISKGKDGSEWKANNTSGYFHEHTKVYRRLNSKSPWKLQTVLPGKLIAKDGLFKLP